MYLFLILCTCIMCCLPPHLPVGLLTVGVTIWMFGDGMAKTVLLGQGLCAASLVPFSFTVLRWVEDRRFATRQKELDSNNNNGGFGVANVDVPVASAMVMGMGAAPQRPVSASTARSSGSYEMVRTFDDKV